MKRRIESYMSYVDHILEANDEHTDWHECIKQHLIQLEFYKHERMAHLFVMILFALVEFICLSMLVSQFTIALSLLFILILVLLVPYIMHYYFLENSVQYMYKQYDRMYLHLHPEGFYEKTKA